jgi:hypothetical protein
MVCASEFALFSWREIQLVYVRGEKRVLGYDNAHGHDHRHYEGKSEPYRFKSIRALLGDFKRDLSKLRLQEDQQ